MNVKHYFVYYFSNGMYIENSGYLRDYFVCKFCNQTVGELFGTEFYNSLDFGSGFEQKDWLNKNTLCLTEEELIIKNLLE